MERKESGAYLYVYVYSCVLHESHVICMNDHDIMHVVAATDLLRKKLLNSIAVMC